MDRLKILRQMYPEATSTFFQTGQASPDQRARCERSSPPTSRWKSGSSTAPWPAMPAVWNAVLARWEQQHHQQVGEAGALGALIAEIGRLEPREEP